MQTEQVEVKAGEKIIATIAVERFDSIEEACGTLSEETVLKMINRQRRSDLTNRTRVAHAQKSPATEITKVARLLKRGELTAPAADEKIRALLKSLNA